MMSSQTSLLSPSDDEAVATSSPAPSRPPPPPPPRMPVRRLYEPDAPKYIPLIGLAITTIVSTWILVAHKTNKQISGALADFAQNERASTQIIVNFLAVLISTLHVFPLCVLFNFSTRLSLVTRGFPLDALKFWTALGNGTPDWSLGKQRIAILVVLWLLYCLPQALWTGSLTPIDGDPMFIKNSGKVKVANYTPSRSAEFYRTWDFVEPMTQNNFGSFSRQPVRNFQGRIITNAGSASTRNGSARVHAKQDNSGYQYVGRSYGAGASVGLVTDGVSAKAYEYMETGYMTNITCYRNRSSTFRLRKHQPRDKDIPGIWLASGELPNGVSDRVEHRKYYLLSRTGLNLFAVMFVAGGVKNFPHLPRGIVSYIGVAAGDNYPGLNATTCTLIMEKQKYKVSVDTANKTVKVSPEPEADVVDLEDSGMTAFASAMALQRMAMMGGTMWASIYANALNSNMDNLRDLKTNVTSDADKFRAISEAFESMVDDCLVASASSQLMIIDDFAEVDISTTVNTVIIGDIYYISILVASNAIIVITYLLMAVWTRGWKNLPVFDHTDIKSVIIASSVSSKSIGTVALEKLHRAGSEWVGDSADTLVSDINIRLKVEDGVQLEPFHNLQPRQSTPSASSMELQQVRPV